MLDSHHIMYHMFKHVLRYQIIIFPSVPGCQYRISQPGESYKYEKWWGYIRGLVHYSQHLLYPSSKASCGGPKPWWKIGGLWLLWFMDVHNIIHQDVHIIESWFEPVGGLFIIYRTSSWRWLFQRNCWASQHRTTLGINSPKGGP